MCIFRSTYAGKFVGYIQSERFLFIILFYFLIARNHDFSLQYILLVFALFYWIVNDWDLFLPADFHYNLNLASDAHWQ